MRPMAERWWFLLGFILFSPTYALASPIIRAAARLDPNQARRQGSEKRQQLGPRQALGKDRFPARIGAMELKDIFCQIDSDCRNVHFGPSFFYDGFRQTHRGPLRGLLEEGRVHSIC